MDYENARRARARNRKGESYCVTWLFIALAIAFCLLPDKAHGQIVGELQAKVPFTFHVGDARLPAGTYRIHVFDGNDTSVLEIASADGATSALFHVNDLQANNPPKEGELIFNKVGNHYFLSQVFDAGNANGSQLEQSRYETRLIDTAAENNMVQQHVPAHRRAASGQ